MPEELDDQVVEQTDSMEMIRSVVAAYGVDDGLAAIYIVRSFDLVGAITMEDAVEHLLKLAIRDRTLT